MDLSCERAPHDDVRLPYFKFPLKQRLKGWPHEGGRIVLMRTSGLNGLPKVPQLINGRS